MIENYKNFHFALLKSSHNSPLNSISNTPKIPKSIQRILDKPRTEVAFIPSLVFRKRKTTIVPRISNRYHNVCFNTPKLRQPTSFLVSKSKNRVL
jgi:hypothetical protein